MASKRNALFNAVIMALESIKKQNGYNNDVQAVARGLVSLGSVTPDKMPFLCLSGMRETRNNITRTHFKADVEISIIGYISKENDTDNIQDKLDGLIEDVTKAIETDPTFGTASLWTEIKTIETDHGDLDKNGAMLIDVVFHYASLGTEP